MTGNVWTEDMLRRFRQLHRTEMSFSQIAAAMAHEFGLEITPNACIGKARRMGLPVRDPGKARVAAAAPRPKMVKIKPVAAPIEPVEAILPVNHVGSVSIYQLNSHTCRWPLGAFRDRPPYQYCGCEPASDTPYCAEHVKTGYNAPRQRWE